jgi:TolB-like protein/Tfp pilus assembly protein PilF
MGDGWLITFTSAVNAVRCAVDIQKQVAARNAKAEEQDRLLLRFGINLGDVIVDKQDIFGDSVNIAARLEALANPGEINVAGSVVEFVGDRLPYAFEDLGDRSLKNIKQPVRVFRVNFSGVAGSRRNVARSVRSFFAKSPGWPIFTVGLVLIAAIAVVYVRLDPFGTDAVPPPALAIPKDIPSIVVLPFVNFKGTDGPSPTSSHIIDGITEDLITDLARLSGLFVIARNSSFAYKDKPQDVRKIGRELGVRYILEGSVRQNDGVFRINAQLVETTTGAHIWASRFDESRGNLFALQDAITSRIVEALKVNLSADEDRRLRARGTRIFAAYDAFFKGWSHLRQRSRKDLREAVEWLKRSVEKDPNFGYAEAALAQAHLLAFRYYWHKDLGLDDQFDALVLARSHLKKAMRAPSAIAHQVQAQIYYLQDRHPEALAETDKAIALNPNDADSHALKGFVLIMMGQPTQAIPIIRQAQRLDPKFPPLYFGYLGEAYFGMKQYENARDMLERAQSLNIDNYFPLIHLIATYGWLGQKEKAKQSLVTLNVLRGKLGLGPYKLEITRRESPYYERADRERLIKGLERAGVK